MDVAGGEQSGRSQFNVIFLILSVPYNSVSTVLTNRSKAHNCHSVHNNMFKDIILLHVAHFPGLSGSTSTAVV